jgi:host factor-I protein
MPPKGRQRLQDVFLSQLIKDRTPVTVWLLNGGKLQGTLLSFDDFCISLVRDGRLQAIYKQEISVISTFSPVTLWESSDEAPGREAVSRRSAARTVVVERRRRIRSPG